MLQKANESLGKASATVNTLDKPKKRTIPVEEEDDFKRMFKDLNYSKMSDMDQAYIRNFYVTEMNKIEQRRKGIYRAKIPDHVKRRKSVPKPQTKTIKIKAPKKSKADPAPAPTPSTQFAPKKTEKTPDSTQKTKQESTQGKKSGQASPSPEAPQEILQKGIFARSWLFVLHYKLVILGFIGFLVMSRYAFKMRKLKKSKEDDLKFANVGYEYEHFNVNGHSDASNRRVLQI